MNGMRREVELLMQTIKNIDDQTKSDKYTAKYFEEILKTLGKAKITKSHMDYNNINEFHSIIENLETQSQKERDYVKLNTIFFEEKVKQVQNLFRKLKNSLDFGNECNFLLSLKYLNDFIKCHSLNLQCVEEQMQILSSKNSKDEIDFELKNSKSNQNEEDELELQELKLDSELKFIEEELLKNNFLELSYQNTKTPNLKADCLKIKENISKKAKEYSIAKNKTNDQNNGISQNDLEIDKILKNLEFQILIACNCLNILQKEEEFTKYLHFIMKSNIKKLQQFDDYQ